MTNFDKIANALDEEDLGKKDFTNHYVEFKGNIERGLLYLIDAMFPTYAKAGFADGIVGSGRRQYLMAGYGCLAAALKVTEDRRKQEAAAPMTADGKAKAAAPTTAEGKAKAAAPMTADGKVKETEAYMTAEEKADRLLEALPSVYELLKKDVMAGYQGDPACKSVDEVILAYPAFMAIAAHRIAHVLYREQEPLIARIMSEYAHRRTGIDIHPGAVIGEYFFIDHGTGVVIGETTVIGRHVKLYQHVTLGAKSFPVAADGTLVKGIKRHPNVGDNVVIYAGATILGGDVTIGDNCVIGGNVWLTHSTEPGVTVTQRQN